MRQSFTKSITRQDRRGAALVEMALTLPVFLMVVLGIIEFGRGMMVTQFVTNAAREGARTAVLTDSTNTSIESLVEDIMSDTANVPAAQVTTTISVDNPDGTSKANNSIADADRMDLITVEVEIPFSAVSFTPARWLHGAKLRGHSIMRKE